MANSNIINAVFGSGLCAVTTSAFRANYGMVLRFSGIDLPTAFEVDFSNYDVMGRDSITMIGQNGEVQIPDDLWDSGLNIYAYVYLHPTDDSGVTVYTATIPVLGRPNRTDEEPTPHEQTVIEQAISALNDAVEQTAADVETTAANATAAAQSEANASVSERAAAASASAALASQNAAESAAQSATESASGAAESARNAAQSASQAAESATSAQESAEQAESSVRSIGDDVERAERAANTASTKATEAASSADTASTKATQAEQSATAAAQSASSAASSASQAASSATAAESSATDAEQAKSDAQEAAEAAQAAAEQAAQSVSGLSEQIAQNTADIADLVQSKAGALIDTASGSIASFVPDATVPTVRGLTVDIEPQQDLHGYDHPWPAGGGKNLLDINNIVVGNTTNWSVDVNGDTLTVTHKTGYTTGTPTFAFNQPSGTYVVSMGSVNITGQVSLYVNESWARTINNGDTFTIDAANTNEIKFSAHENQATIITKIQIESGSTATSYTPFSNICPISGWDAVEMTRSGKNLFDQDALYADYKQEDGSFIAPGVHFSTIHQEIPQSLIGQTLTMSAYILVPSGSTITNVRVIAVVNGTNINGNYINESTYTLSSVTFTPQTTNDYVQVSYSAGGGQLTQVKDVQLELGTTATDYTPYLGQSYQIQLGQTVYGGTVDTVNGVLTVDRAEVDLGTLNWVYVSNSNFNLRSSSSINAVLPVNSSDVPNAISSVYPVLSYVDTVNADKSMTIVFATGSAPGSVWVHDTSYTDAAIFKAAMSGVQLVYELATPITINLTPLEISVLTGQTNNIWADCDNVSVEYAADLKTYINNKIAAAVAALS